MKRHLSAIALAAGMLLAGAFLAFYLHQEVKEQVLSQFNESQLLLARQAARQIESYLDARSQDVRYLSLLTPLRHLDVETMPADVQATFTRLKTEYVRDIFILDALGSVVYSTADGAMGSTASYSGVDAWVRNPANKGAVRLVVETPEHRFAPATGPGRDYAQKMLTAKLGTSEYQLKGQETRAAAFAPMTFQDASWIIVVNAPKDEITGFIRTNSLET